MARLLLHLGILLSLTLMGACTPAPIAYDRGATPKIERIGVVSPGASEHASVRLASTIGQSFGVVGPLIDAGLRMAREDRLNTALATRQFHAREMFTTRLNNAVAAQGYRVIPVAAPRRGKEFLNDYAGLPVSEPVDAILDCFADEWGYVAAGVRSTLPFRPTVTVQCRLVRLTDKSTLMRDSVVYNKLDQIGGSVTLAPDPSFGFPDSDMMVADPDRAIAGLDTAFIAVTGAVGGLLK